MRKMQVSQIALEIMDTTSAQNAGIPERISKNDIDNRGLA